MARGWTIGAHALALASPPGRFVNNDKARKFVHGLPKYEPVELSTVFTSSSAECLPGLIESMFGGTAHLEFVLVTVICIFIEFKDGAMELIAAPVLTCSGEGRAELVSVANIVILGLVI